MQNLYLGLSKILIFFRRKNNLILPQDEIKNLEERIDKLTRSLMKTQEILAQVTASHAQVSGNVERLMDILALANIPIRDSIDIFDLEDFTN